MRSQHNLPSTNHRNLPELTIPFFYLKWVVKAIKTWLVYYRFANNIALLTLRTEPVVCPGCNIEDALLLNMKRYIAENTAYT